jgi:hypothetical protein
MSWTFTGTWYVVRGTWYVEERFTFYVLRQALVGPVARSIAAF